MIEVISNEKQIAHWAAHQNQLSKIWDDAEGYGFLVDGRMAGGVIFTGYTGRDIQAHIAIRDSSWCQRQYLRFISEYPFKRKNVIRVSAICREGNEKAVKLAGQWGFKREGCLRQYFADNENALVWGMLKDECNFLEK